jgi:hypothetical protein
MAPSTIQRKLRLLKRLSKTLDSVLYLWQTQRIGPARMLPIREAELDRAAEMLAECLGALVVRDRLAPEETRAPEPRAEPKRCGKMTDGE